MSAPLATYRLQLRDGVTFADAEAALPYLRALGVSHVYLSPILQAAPGSTHGYDVVDPRRVDDALGGDEAFERFCVAARAHGLGVVLDIVPNHMAIGPANPWWWDVLANGRSSRYAGHFDVDWDHPEPHLRDRILLPILDDHYGRVLEAGELRLGWDGRSFAIRYRDERLPVATRSLGELLRLAAARARSDELEFLADVHDALPVAQPGDTAAADRHARDVRVLTDRLASLATEPPIVDAVQAVVATTNADVDALDRLLEQQFYRLAWWRAARRDLSYRRFFDVTTLIGLREEDPRVFRDTHARVLRWIDDGLLDGLRIDHPDGLRDPESYLRALRWAAPRAWIVVEKILGQEEVLRPSWPVAGTTGYEWVARVTRQLTDPAGEAPLGALHARLTGEERAFPELARTAKLEILTDDLGSELGRLTSLLLDVLERHRRHRDHTRHDLHEALRELIASLSVYRTYVRAPEPGATAVVTAEDEALIAEAVASAKTHRPDIPADLFDAIGDLLLWRLGTDDLTAEFVARFQQLTGPATAKGVEDTAVYRDVRLLALDEVGVDPSIWSDPPETFHAAAARAQATHPAAMLTTSTHDTKRSEDVRARSLVLTTIPDRWAAQVDAWLARLAPVRGDLVDGTAAYLALQTLVAAWPITPDRLARYLEKALREAKLRTSWTAPDAAYEAAVQAFVRGALDDAAFVREVESFVAEQLLVPGRVNSLAQVALKMTLPGVPDVYQGNESWDLSLVDPDNRRPVDLALRADLLRTLDRCTPEELRAALDAPDDPGRPKLWLTHRALELRARRPGAFDESASYQGLAVAGASDGPSALAFARGDATGMSLVAVVVPRPSAAPGRGPDPAVTVSLPTGRWRDVLTGAELDGGPTSLTTLLEPFPVALLERLEGRRRERSR